MHACSFFTPLAPHRSDPAATEESRIAACDSDPEFEDAVEEGVEAAEGKKGTLTGVAEPEEENLFGLCVDMLRDASAHVALQLTRVLVAVVRHVGLGTAALRRLLAALFDAGAWSRNASQILLCLADMMQLDSCTDTARADMIGAADGFAMPHVPPIRNQHFFVMDGVSTGVFLGGDGPWMWGEGLAFSVDVWRDGSCESDGVLLKLVGGEFESKQGTDLLCVFIRKGRGGACTGGGGGLVVAVGDGARLTEVDTKLVVPASRWTHVAISLTRHQVQPSVLTAVVDGQRTTAPIKYPPPQNNVRAYMGCAGAAKAARMVRGFKGLVGDIRWPRVHVCVYSTPSVRAVLHRGWRQVMAPVPVPVHLLSTNKTICVRKQQQKPARAGSGALVRREKKEKLDLH